MPNYTDDTHADSDQEALFAELENESTPDTYAAQRIEQLNSELASRKDITNAPTSGPNSGSGSGTLTRNVNAVIPTLASDQALLDATTRFQRCVVHFAHPDFARCATMDKHIERLARLHPDNEVRFIRIDPRDAPFVVEKLKIKVLPCVLGFVDGVVAERIIGFEGLGFGGYDAESEFRTINLEKRLIKAKVLLSNRISAADDEEETDDEERGSDEEKNMGRRRTAIRGSAIRRGGDDDDEDDDWD
ncbi:GTPase inhibitor [Ascosphaera apis ARSEF 7405]|uniref:GTPase inhibitor n=1 Tax=Ascosphaera apis ARSEF 7405 TaxID=392613 RepID=A0A167WBF4_9EURO|nr:GTPase inhibitor [Ascosphaera apis ARSEF 7405]